MANERIIQINGGTRLNNLRSTNDVMELDNSSLGSAQISAAAMAGGIVLAYGKTSLNPANLVLGSTSIYTVGYGTSITPTPTYVSASVMCTSGNLTTLFANVVSDSITSSGFSVALSAPVSDTTHTLVWIAYA